MHWLEGGLSNSSGSLKYKGGFTWMGYKGDVAGARYKGDTAGVRYKGNVTGVGHGEDIATKLCTQIWDMGGVW
jgi:hypothetical protein